MATIDPTQTYDIIHTLTFNTDTGDCAIMLYRGSNTAIAGTVYYRAGTSGEWTELSVSSTTTTFPISSTTMQVGHAWNKSGNNYMTASFYGETKLTGIAISQKAVLSGAMGDYFMYYYAYGCTALTSLSVPDTSGLTSVGSNFMAYYARGCSNLTSLSVPDTSSLESVGDNFMRYYAYGCTELLSVGDPDTSNIETAGSTFFSQYVQGCTKLESVYLPDLSSITSFPSTPFDNFAYNCTSLTKLILPKTNWYADNNVKLYVPAARLGYLKGYTLKYADLAGWKALTAETKTLYLNYIRDADDVIYIPSGGRTQRRKMLAMGML